MKKNSNSNIMIISKMDDEENENVCKSFLKKIFCWNNEN
jgi:hypothetical protein